MRIGRSTILLGTLVLGVGWLGCELKPDEVQTPTQMGNLGNGSFVYECTSNADNGCATGTLDQLPIVALGSRFNLGFMANSSITNAGNPTVVVVAPEYLMNGTDGFVALKEGRAGFVAESSTDGRVIDFSDIAIAAPVALTIAAPGGEPPFPDAGGFGEGGSAPDAGDAGGDAGTPAELAVPIGSKTTLTSLPLGTGDVPLAGSLDVSWTTSNPSVLRLTLPGPAPTMEIEGLSAGSAVITAQAGSVQTTLNVVVN